MQHRPACESKRAHTCKPSAVFSPNARAILPPAAQVQLLDETVRYFLGCIKWFELRPRVDSHGSVSVGGDSRSGNNGQDELVLHRQGNQIFSGDDCEHEHEPCNVVAICGKIRTGKSYLMNALLDNSSVFGVSAQPVSFTRGVHVSATLHPCSAFGATKREHPRLAFCDMEGQGDRGLKYDVKLITPLLVVSKVVILNVLCPNGASSVPPTAHFVPTLAPPLAPPLALPRAGPAKVEILENLGIMMRA